jgi:hypothetical protein
MKTKQLKSITVCFLLLSFSACSQTNPPKKIKPIVKNTTLTSGLFTGDYAAVYKNIKLSANLAENKNVVKGSFFMNGIKNTVNAISKKNIFEGVVINEKKESFPVTATLNNDILKFAITINGEVIDLLLKKAPNITINNMITYQKINKTNTKPSTQLNSKPKDRRLIGTWRHTEVLSSGGYGDYASMATDYFIQFKPNGECLSWTGSSAGGSNSGSFESSGNSNVTIEGWYTEDKTVIYYNLKTKEIIGSRPFIADETRILFKGGSNTIYERIN